jgi:hypothetical protein
MSPQTDQFSTGKFSAPDPEDFTQISRLQDVIGAFRPLSGAFPASYMICLLAVSKEPGFGVTHYASKLGMLQAVVSRILLELGNRTRKGSEGLGLVDSVRDPQDYRVYRYYLTAKGRGFVKHLIQLNRTRN